MVEINNCIRYDEKAEREEKFFMGIRQIIRMNRVERIDDERGIGNGVIVTLRQGWSFDALQDNRVAGVGLMRCVDELIASAKPFAGPYTS